MASHLDLEEQEQLEQLKAFWGQYGTVISWVLVAISIVFVAWNGFQYWQKNQASQASALMDEIERMAAVGNAKNALRGLDEMKNRYPTSIYAQHAAFIVAKTSLQEGNVEDAKASLRWAGEHGGDSALASIARLRLAAILVDSKNYDQAEKVLAVELTDEEYLAAFQDRRGDMFAAKGDRKLAVENYRLAFLSTTEKPELQRLIRIKLNGLGDDVAPARVTDGSQGIPK